MTARTRVDVDQSTVLESIVNTLINTLTLPAGLGLTPKTCYLTLYPDLPLNTQDQLIITVSPEGGTFPEGMQVGGSQFQCTEEAHVLIGIWSRYKTDREGRDANVLNDMTKGILRTKGKVLRCLVGMDLQANYPPGSAGVVGFLREFLLAVNSYAPDHKPEDAYASVVLRFKISWDWNLKDVDFSV